MASDESDGEKRRIPASAVLATQAATVAAAAGTVDIGRLEAKQLSRGLAARDLEREAREKDHARSQAFKTCFELMTIITLCVLFLVFMISGIVWSFHLLAPQFGWLTHDQLDNVQGLLTGGVVAGFLADHVRRRMG